jgi:hypothetical protein
MNTADTHLLSKGVYPSAIFALSNLTIGLIELVFEIYRKTDCSNLDGRIWKFIFFVIVFHLVYSVVFVLVFYSYFRYPGRAPFYMFGMAMFYMSQVVVMFISGLVLLFVFSKGCKHNPMVLLELTFLGVVGIVLVVYRISLTFL